MNDIGRSRRSFLAAAAGIPSLFIVFPDGGRLEAQPPSDALPVGIRYRDGIIERIKLVRKANAEILDKAAHKGVQAIEGGHRCYAFMHAGHTHNADNFEGRIGLPKLFIPLPQFTDWSAIKEGDFLVCTSGDNPPLIDVIKKKRATLVSWTFPYGKDAHHFLEKVNQDKARKDPEPPLSTFAEFMIDTFQEPEDGTLDIPGVRAKFGAQSGPLVMSMFWMIALRMIEMLAEKGVELEVNS
jgi:uncharacterized phosphosugar-binding protein